jgi:anaerobic selenocysteine-containing dehydrogenase
VPLGSAQCSCGRWEANHSPDRLTVPLVRRHGKLEAATWDEAMSLIVERAKHARDEHTASSIGFYTSGQMFLEEYYTLGLIGKAGLGTPHMDGNTRLCTATAAAALKETFGTDGQPGSYWDIDVTDCLFMIGHNMSSTRRIARASEHLPARRVPVEPIGRCTSVTRRSSRPARRARTSISSWTSRGAWTSATRTARPS